jgi:hypothetical protein
VTRFDANKALRGDCTCRSVERPLVRELCQFRLGPLLAGCCPKDELALSIPKLTTADDRLEAMN